MIPGEKVVAFLLDSGETCAQAEKLNSAGSQN